LGFEDTGGTIDSQRLVEIEGEAEMAETQTATRDAAEAATAYFDALAARDLDAMVATWAPGGVDRFVGDTEVTAPDGLREYFSTLFAAFPDLVFEVLDITAQDDRAAVRWRFRATFAGPGTFRDLEPNGARIDVEGFDLLVVEDGLIVRNDAYLDGTSIARQLGLLPAQDSGAERGMTSAFNAKTKLGRAVSGGAPERVADGVWLVRGGVPRSMNVYLLEEPDGGVTLFDAGIKSMPAALVTAAAPLGGIKRVVLGHGHTDHRGAAPALGVPVYCHPDEVSDAEGDGGRRYWEFDKLPWAVRKLHGFLHEHAWDGGPVEIAGTVSEGDEIAGFTVIHFPGHAPGLIGLWRESDRLALVSDVFYTTDMWGRHVPARLPVDAYNLDTAQARQSLRKLAALEPAAAWAGHADPVTSDVRATLERAAES
jgi:steroid delta-isomerase-like uncharacterized protein